MKFEHELIPSTGTLPFNIFTFRAKDLNRMIPQHWHQSTELIYCLEGGLDVWLEGTRFRLKSRDLILINPFTVHATKSPVTNHVLCIQLPLSYLKGLTENQFSVTIKFDLNTVIQPATTINPLHDQLDALTLIYESENQPLPLSVKIEAQARMLAVIAELVANHSVPPTKPNATNGHSPIELMNAVTHYIDQHFYEELSLHSIASAFNYSDSYFSRVFKSNFNMNFHEFLNSVRLNDAVNKLTTSDASIDAIAKTSGFENYRNFYNAFCSVYQISPREYRLNTSRNVII